MDFCSTWNRESDSLWRMSKTFRPWDVEQRVLLSVHELVPAGHLAHFVRDTVREDLDLSRIMETYTEPRGYPPYHPAMMVALLLYAYSRGVYSSRRIARACEERLDFQAVTALTRTRWHHCSTRSPPTPKQRQPRSRPTAATALRPTWPTSTRAG